MKSSLQVGATGQLTSRVGPGQTIALGNDPRASVFSTPSMINLMEHAAREALRPHLDTGEESVGVDVQITHSSATPPKVEVIAEALVTAIEKNVIHFDVVARDPWGEIGRGTHRRAVIKTSDLVDRLAKRKPGKHGLDQPTPAAAKSPPSPTCFACQQTGSLLHLTLNRPAKRNAISVQMTAELEEIVDWLDQHESSVRAVIVTGAAGTFCAGDDVGDLPAAPHDARELSLRRGEVYRRITELRQVFIAAIDGRVLGGGLVFAAACDFRFATHRATFGLPEVLLGWPPNYGIGIVQLLIGRGRALELALTGDAIDARRAESIGLVNRVVSQPQLASETNRFAEQLASLPPAALGSTKRLLSPAVEWSDEAAADAFVECLQSEAARKSIERFR